MGEKEGGGRQRTMGRVERQKGEAGRGQRKMKDEEQGKRQKTMGKTGRMG